MAAPRQELLFCQKKNSKENRTQILNQKLFEQKFTSLAENTFAYTYVIVGGGTSGCLLANRLSQDGRNTVLLLEAGDNLGGKEALAGNPCYSTAVPTVPQSLSDRGVSFAKIQTVYSGGKVLGGASTYDNTIIVRASPSTFDSWVPYSSEEWSYANMFQHLKSLEDYSGNTQTPLDRGTAGEYQITQFSQSGNLLSDRITDAMVKLTGDPLLMDYNTSDAETCVSKCVQLSKHVNSANNTLVRTHAQSAFLSDTVVNAQGRHLNVKTNALARRILFDANKKAVGVEYEYEGKVYVAKNIRQIIVTAGVQSPLLLMRSGVGYFPLLSSLSLPQVYNNRYVGKNLQTHVGIPMFISTTNTAMIGTCKPPNISTDALGIAAMGFHSRLPNVKNDSLRKWQIMATTDISCVNSGFRAAVVSDVGNTFALFGWDLAPLSRGEVYPSDGFTNSLPVVDPHFFEESEDIESIVDLQLYLYEIYKELKSSHPTDGYSLVWPPEHVFSKKNRQLIFETAASQAIVSQHWAGSCRMGYQRDDPATGQGVVDRNLCVHGVSGLMVADLSICPTVPRGNTGQTSLAIASKAADICLLNK